MGTQGALVHTTQGGIRYAAYYDQGGPFEDFTGGEATNSCKLPKEHYILFRATHSEKTIGLKSQGTQRIIMSPIIA